uniref:Uncharacterized protein n=1 Tax=Arundo donax TaxID=35708 RepID=A0A0A9HTZ2_ARUDO
MGIKGLVTSIFLVVLESCFRR